MSGDKPVLCIESSGDSGGAAVMLGARVLSEVPTEGDRSHGALLVPCIHDAISAAGIERSELAGILVNCGPGSYTGLRVGISAAETIGLALSLPVLGVPCLDVMAEEWLRLDRDQATVVITDGELPGCIVPVLDARQGAVSVACFAWDRSEQQVRRLMEDRLIAPEDLLELNQVCEGGLLCFGPGVEPYMGEWPGIVGLHRERVSVRPASVGMAALRLWPDLSAKLLASVGERVKIRYFRPIMAQTIAQREANARELAR